MSQWVICRLQRNAKWCPFCGDEATFSAAAALAAGADGSARNARIVERAIEKIAPIDRAARAVCFQGSSKIGDS